MAQKNNATDGKRNGFDQAPPRALTKVGHVRSEMAKVYRLARTGKLGVQDASKLTYILTNIAKVIENSDLEDRVKALEEAKGEKGGISK